MRDNLRCTFKRMIGSVVCPTMGDVVSSLLRLAITLLRWVEAEVPRRKESPPAVPTTVASTAQPARVRELNTIGHLAFSPSGNRLASASGRQIDVYDLLTPATISVLQTGDVTALAWSPDGRYLASASAGGMVQVWETASGHRLFSFTIYDHPVRTLSWSPDGNVIASGDVKGRVLIWSALEGTCTTRCARVASAAVTALDWSPDGSCLLSGDTRGTVRLWDPVMGTVLRTYPAHDQAITTTAWCPDGQSVLFATASQDGYVKVWHASSGEQLFRYVGHHGPAADDPTPPEVIGCAWSPDGRRIVSVDSQAVLHEWHPPLGVGHPLVAISAPIPGASQRPPVHSLSVRTATRAHGTRVTLVAVAGDGWFSIGPSPAEPVAMDVDFAGGRLSHLRPDTYL